MLVLTVDLALEKVAVLHEQTSSAATLVLLRSGMDTSASPSLTDAASEKAL